MRIKEMYPFKRIKSFMRINKMSFISETPQCMYFIDIHRYDTKMAVL